MTADVLESMEKVEDQMHLETSRAGVPRWVACTINSRILVPASNKLPPALLTDFF